MNWERYGECEGQLSFDDVFGESVKIEKPIRLIELFAGVGSQAMALRNIGANFEHYKVVEFDKYAVASYNAIHGTNFETSDIRQVGGGGFRNKRHRPLHLHYDVFLPLPGSVGCREDAWHGTGIGDKIIAPVRSRKVA